jgi:hypothetical protein
MVAAGANLAGVYNKLTGDPSDPVLSKYSSGWNQKFFNQLRAVTSY